MTTLWAIRHTTNTGSTWLDHTTVRSTRRETWRAYNKAHEGSTDKWLKEIASRRRKGTIRAVKVVLHEHSKRCTANDIFFPKGKQ